LHCLGGVPALRVIKSDTAPRGRKLFVLWNPPLKQEFQSLDPASAEDGDVDANSGVNAHVESITTSKGAAHAGHAPQVIELAEEEKPQPADKKRPVEGTRGARKGRARKTHKPPQRRHRGAALERVRTSTIVETARLFTSLVKRAVRTITFARTRKLTELVLRYSLQDLHATAPALAGLVKGYRGGYTKADRRVIEQELFSQRLLGVTATCALKLGIDVGSLDATLHLGYPGSMSSLWQQAGRAGRGGRPSTAILVAFDSPLDQLFMRKPSMLFSREAEKAIVPWQNEYVVRGQISCAAGELPVRIYRDAASSEEIQGDWIDDAALFGRTACAHAIDYLTTNGTLTLLTSESNCMCYRLHPAVDHPAKSAVSLRMIDPVSIEVVDETLPSQDLDHPEGQVIDSIGYSRAFYELFEGAIYLHQARQYQVTRLDLRTYQALVKPVRVNYFTSSRNHTDVNVIKKLETSLQPDGLISTGCVAVVSTVWGWRKHWQSTGKIAEMGQFSLPPLEYETRAFWIDVPSHIQVRVEEQNLNFVSSIHGVNHLLVSFAPLFVLCEPEDIDTEHTYEFQQRPRPPRIIVFDKRPGGMGISESLFDKADKVLLHLLRCVEECTCHSGCPSCVFHCECSNYNGRIDKNGARIILEGLIELMDATSGTRAPAKDAGEDIKPVVHPAGSASRSPFCALCQESDSSSGHCLACACEAIEQAGEVRGGPGVTGSQSDAGLMIGRRDKRTSQELSERDLLESSPRKAQRLRMAQSMDHARARGASLRTSWIPSMPNFQSMLR